MKIGIATDFYYPWVGGPSGAIRNLSRGLATRGHDVRLLAPSATGSSGIERDGPIEVTRAASIPAPFGYRLRMSLPPRGVGAWLNRVRPDVVHVHHPFPLSTAAVVGARRRGIPVCATNHTIPSCSLWGIREFGPIYSLTSAAMSSWIVNVLSRCDAVATPTETAATLLRDLGFHQSVTTISNGIDTTRFVPGAGDVDLRRRLELDHTPIILYTGRLDAEKQMEVWLRAASEVARHLDVQLVIGGLGTARARLEALTLDLGLHEQAHFIGYVSDEDLPRLYRLADVYFITSPVELQSITTLEAMASGLPVVAVRAAALPELVNDGKNGYLVEEGNEVGAAQALMRILRDPALARSMGCRAREVSLRHAIDLTVEAYERLLEETAAFRRGDRRIDRAPASEK